MPEGDTLYRTAARLRPVLEQKVLRATEFRVPQFAAADLAGQLVTDVRSKGKHLLISTPEAVIWSHLKMEGFWRTYRTDEPWNAPAHAARCILAVEGWQAVGFWLGFLRVLTPEEATDELAFLGPDPLHDWDADLALANLAAHPDVPVGLAILNQRLIAGLGNVYRCEVCFIAGVHPLTPIGDLPDGVLRRIVDLGARLLQANKDRSRRNTTGGAGGSPAWVYGRGGKPCLKCRTRIASEIVAERVLYWCPSCQPLADGISTP